MFLYVGQTFTLFQARLRRCLMNAAPMEYIQMVPGKTLGQFVLNLALSPS